MGDFPTLYDILMKFHEDPQFLVKSTKKKGITWKSANFHDFLDFRRSGSAKALEFACIIRHFLGSAAGVADLELMVKNRKKRVIMKIHGNIKISWNFIKSHEFSWKLWFRAPPRAAIPETVWITALFCRFWGPGLVEFHKFPSFFIKFMIFMIFLKKVRIPSFYGFLWKNKFPAHAKLQNT